MPRCKTPRCSARSSASRESSSCLKMHWRGRACSRKSCHSAKAGVTPKFRRRRVKSCSRSSRVEGGSRAMKIDTNGVTLDVQVEGEGQPVVLIHGFPDTKRLWSKVVPGMVDAGFQVIVPDTRGYGASSKPAEVDAYSIP